MPSIARTVPGEFGLPVVGLRFHLSGAVDTAAAPMPKTAVDEHTRAECGEHEIWFAWQVQLMQSVPQPLTMEKSSDVQLG